MAIKQGTSRQMVYFLIEIGANSCEYISMAFIDIMAPGLLTEFFA